MSTKCTRPWDGNGALGSYKFFDIPGSEETYTNHSGRSTSSLQNRLEARGVEVGTVDGFQGQEREIVILSCVRTGESRNGIGFLNDARRMNVALTRAKCSLYILGNSSALTNSPLWGALIQDAKTRHVFVAYEEDTWRPYRYTQPTNLFKKLNPLVTPLSIDGKFVDKERKSVNDITGEGRAKRRYQ